MDAAKNSDIDIKEEGCCPACTHLQGLETNIFALSTRSQKTVKTAEIHYLMNYLYNSLYNMMIYVLQDLILIVEALF